MIILTIIIAKLSLMNKGINVSYPVKYYSLMGVKKSVTTSIKT